MLETNLKQRIYNSYRNIRQVTNNPNNLQYRRSREKGYDIQDEFGSFRAFYNYVIKKLGPPPHINSVLMRKDQSQSYAPGNLMWGEKSEVGNHNPACIRIRYRGRTRTVSEWAREYGLDVSTVYARFYRGWSTKEMFRTPKQ